MGGLLDFKLPSWQIGKLANSELVARLQGNESTTKTMYPFCGQPSSMAMLMIFISYVLLINTLLECKPMKQYLGPLPHLLWSTSGRCGH